MPQDYSEGVNALNSGDYNGAIAFFHTVVQQHTEDVQAYFYLASAYFQTQSYENVVNTLGWAVHYHPTNPQAHYNLGAAYEKMRRYDEARASLNQAIILQPIYPQAQHLLLKLPQAESPPPAPEIVMRDLNGQPIQSTCTLRVSQQPAYTGTSGYQQTDNFEYAPMLTTEESTLPDAFMSFQDILLTPKYYFMEQAGYSGLTAPFWLYVAFHLTVFFLNMVTLVSHGNPLNIVGTLGSVHNFLTLTIVSTSSWLFTLFFSTLLMLMGLPFTKRKDFSGAVRVSIAATVLPVIAFTLCNILFMHLAPKALPTAPLPSTTTQAAGFQNGTQTQAQTQQLAQEQALNQAVENLTPHYPPCPAGLAVVSTLVNLAILVWYLTLLVMGCIYTLGASKAGAVAMAFISQAVYTGIIVLIGQYLVHMFGSLLHHSQPTMAPQNPIVGQHP